MRHGVRCSIEFSLCPIRYPPSSKACCQSSMVSSFSDFLIYSIWCQNLNSNFDFDLPSYFLAQISRIWDLKSFFLEKDCWNDLWLCFCEMFHLPPPKFTRSYRWNSAGPTKHLKTSHQRMASWIASRMSRDFHNLWHIEIAGKQSYYSDFCLAQSDPVSYQASHPA